MLRDRWKNALIATAVTGAVILIFVQYLKAVDFEERSDCAAYFLDKAKAIQEISLKTQSKVTEQSQLDLMEQIKSAYNCVKTAASHSGIAPGGGSFGQHGDMPPHK